MNLSTLFFLKSRQREEEPNFTRGVKINFYPFRPQMAKEIERCIASGKVDTMLSFCSSCIFNISLKRKDPECNACFVHHGIERAVRQQKRETTEKTPALVSRAIP